METANRAIDKADAKARLCWIAIGVLLESSRKTQERLPAF